MVLPTVSSLEGGAIIQGSVSYGNQLGRANYGNCDQDHRMLIQWHRVYLKPPTHPIVIVLFATNPLSTLTTVMFRTSVA